MKSTILSILLLTSIICNAQQTFNWSKIADYPIDNGAMSSCSDGTYLYAFGKCGNILERSFYRYSPTADKWDQLADMPENQKCGYPLSCVGNKIFFLSYSGMFIYDISSNKWTANPISVPIVQGNSRGSIQTSRVVVGDDIYYQTGVSTGISSFRKFNTSTQTFTELTDFTSGRDYAQMVALGSKIYMIGGIDGTSIPRYDGAVYDINSDTWSALPVTFLRRMKGFAVADKQYIYILSGHVLSGIYRSVEVFDPANNTVTILDTNVNNMDSNHVSGAWGIANNKLIVAGGYRFTNSLPVKYSEACNFNPALTVMKNAKESVDFKLYPNPVKKSLRIHIANPTKVVSIEIYDVVGRRVISEETHNRQDISLDCYDLTAGNYFVKAYGSAGTVQSQPLQVVD